MLVVMTISAPSESPVGRWERAWLVDSSREPDGAPQNKHLGIHHQSTDHHKHDRLWCG